LRRDAGKLWNSHEGLYSALFNHDELLKDTCHAPPRNQLAAFCTTTSDGAHPTEEVYKLIAQIWADAIKQHFELAALRQNQDAHFVVKGSQ
jgi:lysophospholipase L1-like esterase